MHYDQVDIEILVKNFYLPSCTPHKLLQSVHRPAGRGDGGGLCGPGGSVSKGAQGRVPGTQAVRRLWGDAAQ